MLNRLDQARAAGKRSQQFGALLIIDLDHFKNLNDTLGHDIGDGIETIGVGGANGTVLFDHDADGVRTGTGWLLPDDAWLVLDRNGNGRIDSGRELFGVDTLITSTQVIDGVVTYTPRHASNGFEALASLDTGHGALGSAGYGDGDFNASDAQFANLQVWRDLNSDGLSQTSELQSLPQAGITSISLNVTPSSSNLGNGNAMTGTASVTRANGSTTQIDSVLMQAGNLDLTNNPFYRDFTNTIPLSAAARALPDMGGSGVLRDLREAMSSGTAQAAALTNQVLAFAAATTRSAQLAAIDGLLKAWALTGPRLDAAMTDKLESSYPAYLPVSGPLDATDFADLYGLRMDRLGIPWRSEAEAFRQAPAIGTWLPLAARLGAAGYQADSYAPDHGGNTQNNVFAPSVRRPLFLDLEDAQGFVAMVVVLGAFNGEGALSRFVEVVSWSPFDAVYRFNFPAAATEALPLAYAALKDSVYGALVLQTRLRPYLDAVDLIIDQSGIRFDTTAVQTLLIVQP